MRTRYIPALTMLFAGTVTSIISIIWSFEIIYSLKLLLAVLIIFYIVGLIARAVIVKFTSDSSIPESEESVEDTQLQEAATEEQEEE